MAKSKKPRRPQGHKVTDGQKSDERMRVKAEHQDRGVGSSFATAVSKIIKDSRSLKGSQNGFLGVETESLNIKDYT